MSFQAFYGHEMEKHTMERTYSMAFSKGIALNESFDTYLWAPQQAWVKQLRYIELGNYRRDGSYLYTIVCVHGPCMLDTILDYPDPGWKDNLLRHYNMLAFNDENGRRMDDDADNSEDLSTSFLVKMCAQVAARASRSTDARSVAKSTLEIEQVRSSMYTSHETLAQQHMVTSPPTSPVSAALSPVHTLSPVAGSSSATMTKRSQQAPPSSDLTNLDEDLLEDITNTRNKHCSTKSTSTKGKGKQKAIFSDDEEIQ
ncbi:hypothetical protein F5I97DRAFT_1829193 [Phlebopus sp. FC_14]|nr:hypothetical protein F5I97DRAFT_1829193 [Phlebopus sp. FC_14]